MGTVAEYAAPLLPEWRALGGIGGGGSFISGRREEWERTFAVDWWAVCYCARAFLPLFIRPVDHRELDT